MNNSYNPYKIFAKLDRIIEKKQSEVTSELEINELSKLKNVLIDNFSKLSKSKYDTESGRSITFIKSKSYFFISTYWDFLLVQEIIKEINSNFFVYITDFNTLCIKIH